MKVLDLFSGIGGFSLGLERAGMETVAFVEIDPFCRKVLAKHWPDIPCYDDIRELTGERLAADGITPDLICGGFPCQDASVANIDGVGAQGRRTGLFSEAVRLARDMDCPMLLENVPGLLNRGYGDVLGALAEIRFDAQWECIRARDGGADHERERLFILAYPCCPRWQGLVEDDCLLVRAKATFAQHGHAAFGGWRSVVGGEYPLRDSHGLTVAMERRRVSMCGNSVVPQVVEVIGRAIMEADGRAA